MYEPVNRDKHFRQGTFTSSSFYEGFVTIINFGRLFGDVGRMGKCDKLFSARLGLWPCLP
jgi:hypothetical protein